MKAAIWKSINNIVIEEIDIPGIKNGEVLIKVAYSGICGSDITILNGKHVNAKPPVVLGHEFSGTVEESKSRQFKKGDRVVVEPLIPCGICKPCKEGNYNVCRDLKLLGINENGAFAQYVKADADRTFKIPDNMQLMEAAMMEPFSVAFHSMDLSRMRIGDSVLVVGAGPIGAFTGLLSLYHGAKKVMISEISDYRLNLIKKILPGLVLFKANNGNLNNFILDNTDNNGVDIAFECGGTADSVRDCKASLGIKGRLVQIGIPKKPIETDYRDIAYKEQEIIGVRIYSSGVFKRAINFISERRLSLKDFVTDIFSLQDILKAFECANDKERCLKVLIKF